jgi:hypothetical protein
MGHACTPSAPASEKYYVVLHMPLQKALSFMHMPPIKVEGFFMPLHHHKVVD